VLRARNADTAELFVLLQSIQESSGFVAGKILDVSEIDPTHYISLTIH
jgi:hypothetical protein